MLQDKGMIIISVSRYTGGYNHLPGAVNSARKLLRWAESPDEDRNYKVLYLGDDVFDEITVDLVRREVGEFLNSHLFDRLVVYFSGHGIVRSAGDQFWLLTNAASDILQGINVEAFRRGIQKYNIQQLCIIGDACRNTTRDGIEFYGDPIVTLTQKPDRNTQLDRFLSTGLGQYSYQVTTFAEAESCLFSEALVEALSGGVKEAIETEHHRFQPAVTNHKLAKYLEEEVRRRAAMHGEEMLPDVLTGIHPPYNFYKLLTESPAELPETKGEHEPGPSPRIAIMGNSRNGDVYCGPELESRKAILVSWRGKIKNALSDVFFTQNNSGPYHIPSQSPLHYYLYIITDFLPDFIATPSTARIRVKSFGDFYALKISPLQQGAPILLRQDRQWRLTAIYPRVITFILNDYPSDTLFYRLQGDSWDTSLSDFSNVVYGAPVRAAEAGKFADLMRMTKQEYPHHSVTAAYLYEFSNDYSNIARTAHYMAYNEVVPFDLALLCADSIQWRDEGDIVVAYANLPAVKAIDDPEKKRPYYTTTGFDARKNVRLWGIVPVHNQGWSFIQTEGYLGISESLRLISKTIAGRSAPTLTDEELQIFRDEFKYTIYKPRVEFPPTTPTPQLVTVG